MLHSKKPRGTNVLGDKMRLFPKVIRYDGLDTTTLLHEGCTPDPVPECFMNLHSVHSVFKCTRP